MSMKDSKPNLSNFQITGIVERLFGFTPSSIRPLPSYDDQNFIVTTLEGKEYVLKKRGLPVQTVLPTLTGQLMSLEEIDCGFGVKSYMVRLMTYLPGTVLGKMTCTPQILYETGKIAATVDNVLLQMEHPCLESLQRKNFIWSLASVPLLKQYLPVIDGDPMQQIVKGVIEQYQIQVEPKLSSFRKCINHGDFNDHNILVESDDSSNYKIAGILDFGDMSSGYFIFELAITLTYMMIENSSPLDVGGPVIAGWESVIPLNEAEKDALYVLVLSRLCQSLVLGRHAVLQQPENEEYLMLTAKTGVRILFLLWQKGKEEVMRIWLQSAAEYAENYQGAGTKK
ncbi:hydroxylysine kinase isoform X2 [Brachyhypopomus gauderio]|uniref:hydroxylysine kinase isoform X2 n=1 Tax=Brachyhypopomus gauderio TaxID=698409 RepID=UPI0040434509